MSLSTPDHAMRLLDEWACLELARPRDGTIDIQLEKDRCHELVTRLHHQFLWGSESDVIPICDQLESMLHALKTKVIVEVLTREFHK